DGLETWLIQNGYQIPVGASELLQPYVPMGTRIDPFQGRAFVSLVAFLFRDTRVLGVPIPFHRTFEEVNLRFYVVPDMDPTRRAVTFIKEIGPRAVIPLVANTFFGENYVACPMAHSNQRLDHSYSWDDGGMHRVSAQLEGPLTLPSEGSVEEFITEHYWGYSQGPRHTLEYQVEHPQWKCCNVEEYEIAVDFEATYGEPFAALNDATPHSVQYAAGSEVTVSFPKRLPMS
ncbi:MAG: DUF2071 domain-containing protein, partial [Planctomycetota bacterium]